MIDLKGIDNIIFDLGVVVINLDMDETTRQFKALLGDAYDLTMEKLNAVQHFERYEKGQIPTEEFIKGINEASQMDLTQKSPKAWNAMLKDIPDQRYSILKNAMKQFRTFCLSNTNELHIDAVYDYLRNEKGIDNLDTYFEKVYLSHEVGMRKPDEEIFEFVLKENDLVPEKTLFIDDTAGHLIGAEKTGIKTFHLSKGITLEDLFPQFVFS